MCRKQYYCPECECGYDWEELRIIKTDGNINESDWFLCPKCDTDVEEVIEYINVPKVKIA